MPRLSSKEFPSGNAASAIIAELGKMTPETINSSRLEKHKAIELSKKLTATLEGPLNRATELVLKPFIAIAARTAVGLNLFSPIVECKDRSITTQELARITGAEELLVSRIVRALASVDFVTETGQDQWTANATTEAMVLAPVAAGHRFMYDSLVCAAITAPKFLAETGYKSPTEPRDGLIQYANQTKLDIFEFLQTTPSLFQDFNLYMGNTMGSREYWCDWYDVKGRLLNGFDAASSDVLFVDVAGGNGHDLQTFHERFKDYGYKGKLVLQEIPAVLNDIQEGELDEVVERMVHDFFTEQPIKGTLTDYLCIGSTLILYRCPGLQHDPYPTRLVR